jgi:hypothetical protein
MFDCLGLLNGNFHTFFLGKGGEQLLTVVDESTVGTSDQLAAVETIALPLLRTDHLPAVKTVVDEVVLLRHAVTFHTVQVHLLRTGLLLLHPIIIKD